MTSNWAWLVALSYLPVFHPAVIRRDGGGSKFWGEEMRQRHIKQAKQERVDSAGGWLRKTFFKWK